MCKVTSRSKAHRYSAESGLSLPQVESLMTELLHDFRCCRCGKLLARFNGMVEVKCPRCKTVQTGNTIECLTEKADGEEGAPGRGCDPVLR